MSREDLKMLTQEDVGELLNISRGQVQMLREIGIIKAIKTGRNYMFSQEEIRRFQENYGGYDVSNRVMAIQSFKDVNFKIKE